MPNPKLETYKNKATNTVYDLTDAAAQATLEGILDGTDIDSFGDVETALATKVDKVTGKGLSTNDYDDTEKAKVAGAFPRSEQAVLGAKNLLPNNNTTQTINGIPFTKNADGSVTIGAGTASANTSYILGDFKPKAGNYILSRGTTNGQAFLSVTKYNGSTWVAGLVEIGNQAISEKEFTVDYSGYDTLRGFIYIGSGVTISTPYTVYPMVRLASDPDSTFAPYAMTNEELTDAKVNKSAILLNASNDLNDIKNENQVGYYRWESAYPANSPENKTWSIMQMMYYGGGVKQIVYYGADNIYIRQYVSGTWSSWYKFTGTVVS